MSDLVSMTFNIQENGQNTRTQVLSKPIIKVGKRPNSDLCIESEDISRHHAVIEVTSEGIYVIDMGSALGTRVNGKRVNKCSLRTGDELQFGEVRVSVQFGEPYNEQKMQLKLQKAFDDAEVLLRKKYPGLEGSISFGAFGSMDADILTMGPQGLCLQEYSGRTLPLAKGEVPLEKRVRCAEALPQLVQALEKKAQQDALARSRVSEKEAKVRSALDTALNVVRDLA